MKRNNVFLAFTALLFCVGLNAHSQTISKIFAKPEVFLVYRVILSPSVDPAFYEQYWKYRETKPEESSYVKGVLQNTVTLMYSLDWRTFEFKAPLNRDPFFVIRANTPPQGKITLNNIKFLPADLDLLGVILPLKAEFTIPNDVKYVYLGTFVFEWEGSRFDPKLVKRMNELPAAQKFVKKFYGPEANLVPAFIPGMNFYGEDEESEEEKNVEDFDESELIGG